MRDTAQSMLFPHTISEKNAPFMFQTYKLMVTFGAYFFTVIAVFVGLALVSKLIGVL